jgi:hypothetical protein
MTGNAIRTQVQISATEHRDIPRFVLQAMGNLPPQVLDPLWRSRYFAQLPVLRIESRPADSWQLATSGGLKIRFQFEPTVFVVSVSAKSQIEKEAVRPSFYEFAQTIVEPQVLSEIAFDYFSPILLAWSNPLVESAGPYSTAYTYSITDPGAASTGNVVWADAQFTGSDYQARGWVAEPVSRQGFDEEPTLETDNDTGYLTPTYEFGSASIQLPKKVSLTPEQRSRLDTQVHLLPAPSLPPEEEL